MPLFLDSYSRVVVSFVSARARHGFQGSRDGEAAAKILAYSLSAGEHYWNMLNPAADADSAPGAAAASVAAPAVSALATRGRGGRGRGAGGTL